MTRSAWLITPIVMIERAATIAAIITGRWRMRAMPGQLDKKGRVPRQKSAIPTCSVRPELNARAAMIDHSGARPLGGRIVLTTCAMVLPIEVADTDRL